MNRVCGRSRGRVSVFIADIRSSRELESEMRRIVQRRLNDCIDEINEEYDSAILSNFVITIGDEFQGLLVRPSIIVDILWRLKRELPDIRFWVGVGFGTVETPLRDEAFAMDGAAFHRAREAIERAQNEGVHGGVYAGFNSDDIIISGLSRILDWHREGFTDAQREAIRHVRSGETQTEAASRIGVSRQAISKRLSAAGWSAYCEAEESLRSLLSRYSTVEEW